MTVTSTHVSQTGMVDTSGGETLRIFDEEFTVKVAGDQSGSSYALFSGSVAPGGGPPLHAHPGPESVVVLSGEFEFTARVDGDVTVRRGGAGAVFHAPGGMPHRFENLSSERSAMLAVTTPDAVQFLRELAAAFPPGSQPDLEKMLAIHERYRVDTFYGEDGSRPEPPKVGATSARARALAWQLERANEELVELLEVRDDRQWGASCDDTGWSVGVEAHHLAIAQRQFAELVQAIATGQAPPPLTVAQLDALNADHAELAAKVSREETLTLLRESGPAVAAIYRALSDEQLAVSAAVVAGAPPWTVQQLVEHAVAHYAEHGEPIRRAVSC
jgi:quercetin dioxygenase-like cupin family protein